MSQNITRFKIIFSVILASLTLAVMLVGCQDDPIYKPVEIPDAEVEIRGEVIFRPLVPTEVKTRSKAPDGSKYKGIKSLYLFFFNVERNQVSDFSGEITNFTTVPSEGSTHEHVAFTKKVRAGQYYVYAVANISADEAAELLQKTNVDDFKGYPLKWNDDIDRDLEMFGVFKDSKDDSAAPDNNGFDEDVLLTVTPKQHSFHSWVRRAVSKVTVDFDGKNLKDGVTVYIKNAVIKDVADHVLLGSDSRVDGKDIRLVQSQYSINYGEGTDYKSWPTVTKSGAFSPDPSWNVEKFHDDAAPALPCYENMQGEPEGKSKLQDRNDDGIIDSEIKDGVENGTYLEVEGYYVSNRTEYKSNGKIIYRFMLGKDAVKNFDLVRNHHYKITMQFKDYGNDVDWHIEYQEQVLDATNPKNVDYNGEFFIPDNRWSVDNNSYPISPNGGHTFESNNEIVLTSYATGISSDPWIEPDNISYTYYIHDAKNNGWLLDNAASWLELKGVTSKDDKSKIYTYIAGKDTPQHFTVNSLLQNAPAKGSQSSPYNLSNPNGGSEVVNTANSYIVGAGGWYSIPLVYGNGISDGSYNTQAYSSPHIVNHLNQRISDDGPYIADNVDLKNAKVKIIWQDAKGLIEPSNITYRSDLFGGKGGIVFHIGTIVEGNAVIALIDGNKTTDDEYIIGENTKAIWSWHIWTTRFGSDDFEKHIKIRDHNENEFEIMPVNLGWCSGNTEIKYYRRRRCEITFTVGDRTITRTIEQYPHWVFPRGDHPYYQWGRKDPFVGSNTPFGNKERWSNDDNVEHGTGGENNPPRLYNEPEKEYKKDKRRHTKDCIHELIKNPDKWHNSPRWPVDLDDLEHKRGFYSINKSYEDLWSYNGHKTIYDPCPAGYQVGNKNIYTGFTTSGSNERYNEYLATTYPNDTIPKRWNDVIEPNMPSEDYNKSKVNSQVIEFYTDTRKIQSVAFPITGYRDFDGKAEVVQYPGSITKPTEGYNGVGYVWTNKSKDVTRSYHLKIQRDDLDDKKWELRYGEVSPFDDFYNTDGFAVRPVRIVNK